MSLPPEFGYRTDDRLIEAMRIACARKMTREEIAIQRRSWVRGEMMLEHPHMTAEQVDAIIDRVEKDHAGA